MQEKLKGDPNKNQNKRERKNVSKKKTCKSFKKPKKNI